MRLKLLLLFLSYWIYPQMPFAQCKIKITVYNQNGQVIPNALASVNDTSRSRVLSHGLTDLKGSFFAVLRQNVFRVELRALGSKYYDSLFVCSKQDSLYNFSVFLYPEVRVLDEVIVRSDNTIIEKGDTISIKTKAFVIGDEKVLEDLLKRLPGLDVGNDGSIRVNGKEIEKIMVEGDDFFDKGYKMLSQNMPPNVVDRVEIIQRYEPRRLRKGLKESDKVALNLKLTDDAKRRWFGNIDVSISPPSSQFYTGKTNLMNFKKKTKTYLLAAANSMGENINISLLDQIGNAKEEVADDNQQINVLQPEVVFAANSIILPEKKYSFNRMMINSGNMIIRPFNNTKVRVGLNRISDRIETFQATEESFILKDTAFKNKENMHIQKQAITYLGKVNWQTDIDSISTFTADMYWLGSNNNENVNTNFNEKPLFGNSIFNQEYLSYKATLAKRINKKNLIQVTVFGSFESLPLEYTNIPFLPASYFSIPTTSNSLQTIQQSRTEKNISLGYINKISPTAILDISIGYSSQETNQVAKLIFKDADSVFEAGNNFRGDVFLDQHKFYSKISLNKKWKSLSFAPSIEMVQVDQNYSGFKMLKLSQTFLNPSFSLGFQPHRKHKLLGIIGLANSVPAFENVQPIFLMNGFRNFQRGSSNVEPIRQSTKIFSYTLGNWADRFFVNLFYLDIIDHHFLGTNSIITPNAVFAEKIWLQDKQTQSLNASADFFVNQINSNLKLSSQLSNATFYNVVNSSNIRKIESSSITVGLETKSVFKGIYNHHIGIRRITSYNRSELNRSFIYHSGFIDFYLRANKLGSLKIKTEGFQFPKDRVNKDFLLFSDIEWSKSLIESKLNIGFSISNLWNQTEFVNISLSDISVSNSTTKLLPRVLLVNVAYRF